MEESIRETTDAMREPGADVGAPVTRLARRQAERARVDAEPVEPNVELVETDQTFADR